MGNDLIGDTSGFLYIKQSMINYHIIPQWNPYITQGLPVFADPLNSFFNPLVAFFVMIFPFELALKFIIFFSIFLSGITFYLLLNFFNIKKSISILIALIYMSSGFMVARIMAGHLELILSYPLIPLFFLFTFNLLKTKRFLFVFLIAIILQLFLLSASIYIIYYSIIILFSLILLFFTQIILLKNIKDSLTKIILLSLSILLFLCISTFKIIPMMEVNQSLVKGIMPFIGGQNFFSIVYNLFLPVPSVFSVFKLSQYIQSPYLWWESFAFIGPAPLIALIYLFINFNSIKNKYKYINTIILLLTVTILFTVIDIPFNPFHILINLVPFLQKFRIPSRIFVFVITFLLVLTGIVFNFLHDKYRKNVFFKYIIVFILVVASALNFIIFRSYLNIKNNFTLKNGYETAIDYLNKYDSSYYYIGQSELFQNQIPQYKLVNKNILLLNPMYGYELNNSDFSKYISLQFDTQKKQYTGVYPKYFLYPKGYIPPSVFNAVILRKFNNVNLFESNKYSPFVYLSRYNRVITLKENVYQNEIKKILILPNKIKITINSNSKNKNLYLLESNYFGWTVFKDGKQEQLIKYKYLGVKLSKGLHNYEFIYHSSTFSIGLLISIFSYIILAIVFMINLIRVKYKFYEKA